MKYKGFTLTEILVTMTVIGVVSALTLPSFMSNHQKRVYATNLRKAVNTVSNAVEDYMVKEGVQDLTSTLNSADSLKEFVEGYFKVVNNCSNSRYGANNVHCFNETYRSLTGGKTAKPSVWGTCDYAVVLSDGMAMAFSYRNSDTALIVDVDINGVNGPNVSGRDLFRFAVNSEGNIVDACNYDADSDTYGWCMTRYSGFVWTSTAAYPYSIGRIMANSWKLVD